MRIRNYIMGGLAGLVGLAGCISPQTLHEKLGVPPNFVIQDGDYFMSHPSSMDLNIIAGIYAGTIKVTKHGPGKFRFDGSYKKVSCPAAMRKAINEADINQDNFITEYESQALLSKVLEENAKTLK